MPAPSPEIACLIRQLESTTDLSDKDRKGLATLTVRTRVINERRDIVRENSRPVECCIVVDGMVCRYKMLSNGRRQILSFHFAGDVPDLQSLHLEVMDHTLATVTSSRVAFVSHSEIFALSNEHPRLANILTKHSLIEASIYREWIANVGRRTALERVAHVICECFVRLRAVGLATLNDFQLPLTQVELGDATGLSNVHVNRTMKELRRLGLIETSGKVHRIRDWEMLQETADFDPAYLHLKRMTPL